MSHNQTMEMQVNKNAVQTKANQPSLNACDLAEFYAYKRGKRIAELSSALERSEAVLGKGEDMQRVCERAVRLKQACVKLPLTKLSQAFYYLNGSGVKLDCLIGGDGETVSKVKAYEAKLATKRGATEITLTITPSLIDCCRYGEIRREIKRVKRSMGKAVLKVRVQRANSQTALGRIARIASEVGAKFFSVPYFDGCERLKLDLTNGCLLEVTGVETKAQFQSLIRLGVGRIATSSAWEIYNEWVREANTPIQTTIKPPADNATDSETTAQSTQDTAKPQEKTEEKPEEPKKEETQKTGNPETDYQCRLEGSDLKFL